MMHSIADSAGQQAPWRSQGCVVICLLTKEEGEGRTRLGVAAAQRAHEHQAARGLRDVDKAAAADAQHGTHAAHIDVAPLIHLPQNSCIFGACHSTSRAQSSMLQVDFR